MKKYLSLSSAEVSAYSALYKVDLRHTTASRLFRMSRGATEEALSCLCGRVAVFEYKSSKNGFGMRFFPVKECFTRGEWAGLKDASFSSSAIANEFSYQRFTNDGVLCLMCGAYVAPERKEAHRCDEVKCGICGKFVQTKEEKEHRLCEACQRDRIGRLYGYHGRTNRTAPLFEKPDQRETDPHLGFEVEFGGSCEFDRTNASARALSNVINGSENAFFPLCEFETDASLDDGMECILRPLTLSGLEKRESVLGEFYEKTKELGGRYGTVNGLHCHIDRAFFGEDSETRAKCAVLIEMMIYKYFDFFAKISHRENGRFGYAHKKESVNGLASAFINAREQDHSYAVNGSNSGTVEVRLFGGHISTAGGLLAVADIVRAVAIWAKKTSIAGAEKATPRDLVRYIRNAERVFAFVSERTPHQTTSTNGDAMLELFKNALREKIQRGAK